MKPYLNTVYVMQIMPMYVYMYIFCSIFLHNFFSAQRIVIYRTYWWRSTRQANIWHGVTSFLGCLPALVLVSIRSLQLKEVCSIIFDNLPLTYKLCNYLTISLFVGLKYCPLAAWFLALRNTKARSTSSGICIKW